MVSISSGILFSFSCYFLRYLVVYLLRKLCIWPDSLVTFTCSSLEFCFCRWRLVLKDIKITLFDEVSIDIGKLTVCIRNIIEDGSVCDIRDVHICFVSVAMLSRITKTVIRLSLGEQQSTSAAASRAKTTKRSSDVGYEYVCDSGCMENFEEVHNDSPDASYRILQSWFINIQYKLKVIVKQAKVSVVVSNKQMTVFVEELRYCRTSPQGKALLFDRDLMLCNVCCVLSSYSTPPPKQQQQQQQQQQQHEEKYATVRLQGYSKYSASDGTLRVGQVDAALSYEHVDNLLSLVQEVGTMLAADKKSVTFASEETQDLVHKKVATLVALYKRNRYRFRYTSTDSNESSSLNQREMETEKVRIRSLAASVVDNGVTVCALSCGAISITKTVSRNRLYRLSRTCTGLAVTSVSVVSGTNHWTVQDVHVDSAVRSNCVSIDTTHASVSLKLVSLQLASLSHSSWTALNDLLQQYIPLVQLVEKHLLNRNTPTLGISLHFKCGCFRVQTIVALTDLSMESVATNLDVSVADLSSGQCTAVLDRVKVQAREAMYICSTGKVLLRLQYSPFEWDSIVKFCKTSNVVLEYRKVCTLSIRSVVTDKRLSRAPLQLPPLVLSRIDLNLLAGSRDIVLLPLTLHSEYCVFKAHQSMQDNEKVEIIVTNTLVTLHVHEDYNTQFKCPRVFAKVLLPAVTSAISLLTEGEDCSGLAHPICVAVGAELQMRVKQLDSVDQTPKRYIQGRCMTVKGPFKFRAMLDLTTTKGVNHFEILYKSLVVDYMHTKEAPLMRVLQMQSCDSSNVLKVYWKLVDGTQVDQVVLHPLVVIHVHANYDYLSFLSKFVDIVSSAVFSDASSHDVASSWLIKGIQSYLEKTLYSIPSLITNLQTYLHVPVTAATTCLADSDEFDDESDNGASLWEGNSSKEKSNRYFLHACTVKAKLLLAKSRSEVDPSHKDQPALYLSLSVHQCQFHALTAIDIGNNVSLELISIG